MDKKTKRNLDYVDGYQTEDGIVLPKMRTKMVVTSYVKKYSNCLYLTYDLSASASCMLDYLSQRMDDDNRVATNSIVIEDFITFMRYVSHGQCNYTMATAKYALTVLKKKGILIQVSRGASIVNPEYFFAGTEANRMKLLKELYEKKYLVQKTSNRMEELVEMREVEEDPVVIPVQHTDPYLARGLGFSVEDMLREIREA